MKKPCRECIHCAESSFGKFFDKCKKATRWEYCDLQREESFILSYIFKTCGKRGKWFEAKPNKISLEEYVIKKLQENGEVKR